MENVRSEALEDPADSTAAISSLTARVGIFQDGQPGDPGTERPLLMSDEIDQEGLADLHGQATVPEEQHDIEKVPGVLPVEGGADLAAVEVRGGEDPGLEIELLAQVPAGGRAEVPVLAGEKRPADDGVGLDFDDGVPGLRRRTRVRPWSSRQATSASRILPTMA